MRRVGDAPRRPRRLIPRPLATAPLHRALALPGSPTEPAAADPAVSGARRRPSRRRSDVGAIEAVRPSRRLPRSARVSPGFACLSPGAPCWPRRAPPYVVARPSDSPRWLVLTYATRIYADERPRLPRELRLGGNPGCPPQEPGPDADRRTNASRPSGSSGGAVDYRELPTPGKRLAAAFGMTPTPSPAPTPSPSPTPSRASPARPHRPHGTASASPTAVARRSTRCHAPPAHERQRRSPHPLRHRSRPTRRSCSSAMSRPIGRRCTALPWKTW